MAKLLDSALKVFRVDDNEIIDNGSSETNKMVINSSKNNKSRNLIYMPNIGAMKKPIFLISNAKKTFNFLRQAFIKAPIFYYFDLENYI